MLKYCYGGPSIKEPGGLVDIHLQGTRPLIKWSLVWLQRSHCARCMCVHLLMYINMVHTKISLVLNVICTIVATLIYVQSPITDNGIQSQINELQQSICMICQVSNETGKV